MEAFAVIAGVCSVLSFLVSLFVASQVIMIRQSINVHGIGNVTAGRDINPSS